MGLSFSCPPAAYNDIESILESVIVTSINFGENEQRTPLRSVSFKGQNTEPTILQSVGSSKILIEKKVSFSTRDNVMKGNVCVKAPLEDNCKSAPIGAESTEMDSQPPRSDNMMTGTPKSPVVYTNNPKHEAAIKLQKVYKSFRTRRKLADCAVLIEQSWWKLLDFAELKHSSVSFFDLEKHESAISRWSRARTRAAKLGKGLSKNCKAKKLALQHWLEAIDPRHRYGHNLHFYYVQWLHSQSKEPFFYWLDIGEGKEVNPVDKCPRWKLQQQCIKYLGPMERKAYEVVVEDGKLFYKQTGELLDTGDLKGAKWIFVLSTSKTLYVGKKKKGTFQHSSFLAGGATLAAGRIVVENGTLKAVWPHSGHYQPTPENFQDLILFLKENNLKLTDVKLDCIDEEQFIGKESGIYSRNNSSEDDLPENSGLETEENDVEDSTSEKCEPKEKEIASALELPKPGLSPNFSLKLANLEIPSKDDFLERLKNESLTKLNSNTFVLEPPMDGYESAEETFPFEQDHRELNNSFDGDAEESKEETIPEESILQRINSHKEAKSYQLGNQLSCKWSTGAGPRIGCVRDYPSQLQSHALGEVSLSPKSAHRLRLEFPSRASTPTSLNWEMQVPCSLSPLGNRNLSQKFRCLSRRHSSPLRKETLVTSVAAELHAS